MGAARRFLRSLHGRQGMRGRAAIIGNAGKLLPSGDQASRHAVDATAPDSRPPSGGPHVKIAINGH